MDMSLITQTSKISQNIGAVQNAVQGTGLANPAATNAAPSTSSTLNSVPSTSSTVNSSGSGSSGSGLVSSNAGVQSEFNTFLTLLTTELQNQDPTSPLDTNQFTSQLVQFSQLEQQLNTNTNLQTLISGQQTGTMGTAIGYIGHTIEAAGGNFVLDGTDADTLTYNLPAAAASATINILNSSGQTVAQIPGTTTSGQNDVSYNGSSPGQPTLAPGQYSFTVSAFNAAGTAIPASVFTSGVVTGVDNTGGTINLSIGNLLIPASAVVQVTS
jgi:flagellar basal-body rod modification protein FlgD